VASIFAASLALLGSGCTGDAPPSARDRAEAHRYVDAAAEFTSVSSRAARAADLRIASTFSECSLVRLGSTPGLPPFAKLAPISLVAYYRAVLPAYRRLAQNLTAVRAEDGTLQDVSEAVRAIGAGYGELRSARPDYCHTLRVWQAAGWKKGFSVLRAIGVRGRSFTSKGAPRTPAVQAAERTVAASATRLRELGVAEPRVVAFLLAADAFAAARGGYAEIVRLGQG
jgi:hypothetical protein